MVLRCTGLLKNLIILEGMSESRLKVHLVTYLKLKVKWRKISKNSKVSLPKGITRKKIFRKKGSIERSGRRYFRGRKSFGNKDLESNGLRKGIKTLLFFIG